MVVEVENEQGPITGRSTDNDGIDVLPSSPCTTTFPRSLRWIVLTHAASTARTQVTEACDTQLSAAGGRLLVASEATHPLDSAQDILRPKEGRMGHWREDYRIHPVPSHPHLPKTGNCGHPSKSTTPLWFSFSLASVCGIRLMCYRCSGRSVCRDAMPHAANFGRISCPHFAQSETR